MTYTYTTEDIRDCYHGCTHDCVDSHDRANFDAWITEHERKIAERAWDEAINAMKYEDGSPVELVTNINPYRSQP